MRDVIMKRLKVILYRILLSGLILSFTTSVYASDAAKFTISGRVKDKSDGEMLIGVSVYITELKVGTTTNAYGYYSINLPSGSYTISYSYIGYGTISKQINLKGNTTIDIELDVNQVLIDEVEIVGERKDENINKAEMSVVKIDAKTIKSIPALFGEVDVIKAIQMLPGVQASGEGMSGFNVRGGGSDQNLIILDEATVYNASHLMGFFSVFNNDAVKDVKLYKGDIPSEYGGRLSSLLDIRMKDGNMKELSGTGGIGTISSRLTIEGPIIKDKCSFMVSGRRSYADLFLLASKDTNMQKTKLYFYDLNMKLNYIMDEKNRFYLSGYLGRDVFKFSKEFGINWGNNTETFRWNHLFSSKLFSNMTFLLSNYDYSMESNTSMQGFKWIAKMRDYSIKPDFTYYLNPENTIKFGFITTYHHFEPGYANGTGDNSIFNELKMPGSNALESALFISNEQKVNALLTLNYGLRYSVFQSIGSSTVFNYDNNHQSIDSTVFGKGNFYNTYAGFEPRLSLKYSLNEFSSVKAAYSRTRQYLHLASNSTGGMPLDIWLPSGKNIEPRIADMLAIGYFRNFRHNTIEASVEAYYKEVQNEIDFKDHAQLLLNQKIEGELRFGRAKSYGLEFLLRKQEGKFTGWISYTWARAFRKIDEINYGIEYPASYDKPHNISFVLNYVLSKRISLSLNWIYASGAAATFPTGRFEYNNIIVPVYSERNTYRMPDYHRLDIGATIKLGKDKPEKKFFSELNISVYNAYNRKNAWMISFEPDENDPNTINAYKYYLFPILPSVTYNFHF